MGDPTFSFCLFTNATKWDFSCLLSFASHLSSEGSRPTPIPPFALSQISAGADHRPFVSPKTNAEGRRNRSRSAWVVNAIGTGLSSGLVFINDVMRGLGRLLPSETEIEMIIRSPRPPSWTEEGRDARLSSPIRSGPGTKFAETSSPDVAHVAELE